MDQFFRIIVYIIMANLAYLIFSLIKQGFKHYSNYIAELLFFTIGIFWLLQREVESGWVLLLSIVGIIILVILPVMLQGKIDSLMAESRLDEIEFFAKIKAAIAWSGPNSHLHEMAEIASEYAESPMKMVEKLKELLGRGEPYDGMTRMFLGTIHFNSRNFNELINDLRVPDKSFDEHSFEELLYLVRAYLETTRYDEAVEAQIALEKKIYETSENKSERITNAIINRFVFYAFMGWKKEYDAFLASNEEGLEKLPQELKDFWRGVCYFYSGSYDEGEKQMKDVVDKLPEEAYVYKEFMQKRMFGMLEHKVFFDKHVLPKLVELHEKYKGEISELIDSNSKSNVEVKPQKTVTDILSFVILVVSVIYIVAFNVEDTVELINMGALSSSLVMNGEYFRLVSYTFVHIGYIHLFMNLLALKYFGPPVETVAGWGAFLFIFFGSGIAGGAMSTYLGKSLTVGASGGVLGLLAASIIFELFKIKGANTFSNQSNFSNLFFILCINIAFGFIEKGIDNYAHIGGMISGALLGLLFTQLIRNKFLKRTLNVLSFMIIFVILGYTLFYHINGFKKDEFYPINEKNYKEYDIKVSSAVFSLQYPSSWKIKENQNEFQGVNFKGPFSEELNIVVGSNPDSKEVFLKNYMKDRSLEFNKEREIDLSSVTDPVEVSYRDNTYKIVWDIKAYGKNIIFEDYIIFDKYIEDNDLAYIVRLIVFSKHYQKYDSLMEHIVTSLKIK